MIFQEAFRTIRGSLPIWLLTTFTVAVTLSLAGLLAVVSYKANVTLDEMRSKVKTEAFFAPQVSSEEASAIVERSIRTLPKIRQISLITKEQAREDYKRSSGEDVVTILGANPLPASVEVTLSDNSTADLKELVTRLQGIGGVESVRTNAALLVSLEARSQSLKSVAILVGILLGVIALGFLGVAARTSLMARRDRLHSMNLLGAKLLLVRAPFIIEGGMSGLLGGALGSLILIAIYRLSTSMMSSDLAIQEGGSRLIVIAVPTLAGVGLLLGVLASAIATWRKVIRL